MLSANGRYCCKSPKLPGADFPAVRQSDPRPSIDVASINYVRRASRAWASCRCPCTSPCRKGLSGGYYGGCRLLFACHERPRLGDFSEAPPRFHRMLAAQGITAWQLRSCLYSSASHLRPGGMPFSGSKSRKIDRCPCFSRRDRILLAAAMSLLL